MKYEVEKKNGHIYVTVELPPYGGRLQVPRMSLSTEALLEVLAKDNVKVGECVSEGTARNTREHYRIGTWAFKEPTTPKPPAPKKTRTYKTKKKIKSEDE